MNKRKSLFIVCFFFAGILIARADSPLTSTLFYKAYLDVSIISSDSTSNGILSNEHLEFLLEPNNDISHKMALVNKLGWDVKGKDNSKRFLDRLFKLKNYGDLERFKIEGTAHELICYAYLKAMDHYQDVADALIFANCSVKKDLGSYTINMITALIKAQIYVYGNWCAVYTVCNKVRLDKGLNADFRPEATDRIFEYIDAYAKYCKKKKK